MVLNYILWIVCSGVIGSGGALLLMVFLLTRSEREAVRMMTPQTFFKLLFGGEQIEDHLTEILALGNDYVVIFILNALQKRELWSVGKNLRDLRRIAKRHRNWRVRFAALETIAALQTTAAEHEEVRLMLAKEMQSPGIPPAQHELLKVAAASLRPIA